MGVQCDWVTDFFILHWQSRENVFMKKLSYRRCYLEIGCSTICVEKRGNVKHFYIMYKEWIIVFFRLVCRGEYERTMQRWCQIFGGSEYRMVALMHWDMMMEKHGGWPVILSSCEERILCSRCLLALLLQKVLLCFVLGYERGCFWWRREGGCKKITKSGTTFHEVHHTRWVKHIKIKSKTFTREE